MKKPIILSLIIMCISIVLGKVLNDWMLTIKICGSIGLVCLGIAVILNDTFISRDRLITNDSSNKEEDKVLRSKISNFVMVIGSTNIILAVVLLI
ncbi:MAG: DUF5316 family protein [Clostridium sp.]|uniref:DUF5316 family protein n=1 Tax=Clostridium sp. TaxID=1506 RepID=UPI003D6D3B5A